jgi:hypothetical protein
VAPGSNSAPPQQSPGVGSGTDTAIGAGTGDASQRCSAIRLADGTTGATAAAAAADGQRSTAVELDRVMHTVGRLGTQIAALRALVRAGATDGADMEVRGERGGGGRGVRGEEGGGE